MASENTRNSSKKKARRSSSEKTVTNASDKPKKSKPAPTLTLGNLSIGKSDSENGSSRKTNKPKGRLGGFRNREKAGGGAARAHITRYARGHVPVSIRRLLGLDDDANRFTMSEEVYVLVKTVEACRAGEREAVAQALVQAAEGMEGEEAAEAMIEFAEAELTEGMADMLRGPRFYPGRNLDGTKADETDLWGCPLDMAEQHSNG